MMRGRAPRWATIAAATAGAVLTGAGAAAGVGRAAWTRETARVLGRLRSETGTDAPPPAFHAARLEGVPAPAARYLARVIPENHEGPRMVRVVWSGQFRTRPRGAWAPFSAVQHFSTVRPGFVWDASIRVLPFVSARVRDSYIAGVGAMRGSIGGVVPIVNEAGSAGIAQSALTRWLGEAVWFPTALLDRAVAWEAVDDGVARATASDGGVHAAAQFHFKPTGEIARMTSDRHRSVDGASVLTPFEGEYFSYFRWNGVLVPARSEVAWLLPEGRFSYWRGAVERIEYLD